MTEQDKEAVEAAGKYVEKCDNESGSFLQRDLEKIRSKGFLAGVEWQKQREKPVIVEDLDD